MNTSSKLQKRYYSLHEAAQITKCTVDEIIHFGATNQIAIYVLADNWLVDVYAIRSEITELGQHHANEIKISDKPIYITQPVMLHCESVARFEANPNAVIYELVGDPPIDPDPEEDCDYVYRFFIPTDTTEKKRGVSLSNTKLVIFKEEFVKLNPELMESEEKPLGQRERSNLYSIIAGLSKKAGIDLNELSKSASLIEDAVSSVGGTIKHEAIGQTIKKIPKEFVFKTKKN